MIRWLCLLLIIHGPQAVIAADKTNLQHGARSFMAYCSGCHSLKYMRYERIEHDLGLQLIGYPQSGPMTISMLESDARQWFGIAPPDLSNIMHQHSSSWVYAYLNGFYADKRRPFGSNNKLVPDVAMPNVMAPLQLRVKLGAMTQHELDGTLKDIVAFLDYVADPDASRHYQIGLIVTGFLAVLWLLLYLIVNNF